MSSNYSSIARLERTLMATYNVPYASVRDSVKEGRAALGMSRWADTTPELEAACHRICDPKGLLRKITHIPSSCPTKPSPSRHKKEDMCSPSTHLEPITKLQELRFDEECGTHNEKAALVTNAESTNSDESATSISNATERNMSSNHSSIARLERTLMATYNVPYASARNCVKEGRAALGMSRWADTTPELEAACHRICDPMGLLRKMTRIPFCCPTKPSLSRHNTEVTCLALNIFEPSKKLQRLRLDEESETHNEEATSVTTAESTNSEAYSTSSNNATESQGSVRPSVTPSVSISSEEAPLPSEIVTENQGSERSEKSRQRSSNVAPEGAIGISAELQDFIDMAEEAKIDITAELKEILVNATDEVEANEQAAAMELNPSRNLHAHVNLEAPSDVAPEAAIGISAEQHDFIDEADEAKIDITAELKEILVNVTDEVEATEQAAATELNPWRNLHAAVNLEAPSDVAPEAAIGISVELQDFIDEADEAKIDIPAELKEILDKISNEQDTSELEVEKGEDELFSTPKYLTPSETLVDESTVDTTGASESSGEAASSSDKNATDSSTQEQSEVSPDDCSNGSIEAAIGIVTEMQELVGKAIDENECEEKATSELAVEKDGGRSTFSENFANTERTDDESPTEEDMILIPLTEWKSSEQAFSPIVNPTYCGEREPADECSQESLSIKAATDITAKMRRILETAKADSEILEHATTELVIGRDLDAVSCAFSDLTSPFCTNLPDPPGIHGIEIENANVECESVISDSTELVERDEEEEEEEPTGKHGGEAVVARGSTTRLAADPDAATISCASSVLYSPPIVVPPNADQRQPTEKPNSAATATNENLTNQDSVTETENVARVVHDATKQTTNINLDATSTTSETESDLNDSATPDGSEPSKSVRSNQEHLAEAVKSINSIASGQNQASDGKKSGPPKVIYLLHQYMDCEDEDKKRREKALKWLSQCEEMLAIARQGDTPEKSVNRSTSGSRSKSGQFREPKQTNKRAASARPAAMKQPIQRSVSEILSTTSGQRKGPKQTIKRKTLAKNVVTVQRTKPEQPVQPSASESPTKSAEPKRKYYRPNLLMVRGCATGLRRNQKQRVTKASQPERFRVNSIEIPAPNTLDEKMAPLKESKMCSKSLTQMVNSQAQVLQHHFPVSG